MEFRQQFNFPDLFDGFASAWQKSIQNYLNNFSGYQNDLRDITTAYFHLFGKLAVNPGHLLKAHSLQLDLAMKQQELVKELYLSNEELPEISDKHEKRFAAPEWKSHPYFEFISRNHLLLEEFWAQLINVAELESRHQRKVGFYTKQFLDAMAPSNFLHTNPEALNQAIQTGGQSLWKGFTNLVSDIERGSITQTDSSAFEVGKNLAITKGYVIYENDLMQLIRYDPLVKNVHAIPLLMVPPWINKFYILDLRPENSFVKYLLEQGIQVFIISWKNPPESTNSFSFDDYVCKGAIKGIEVVAAASGSEKVNALGYCLGGTLMSVASSVLAMNKKENPVNSLTLLAAMIDFSDIGPMGDVIDSALVKKMQRGELLEDGVMPGKTMEMAFNLIRAKDLIWYYVINNYLKGKTPQPFDVLYWTNDNTNLPAAMYVFYLSQMVFENKLSRRNALRICDTPIDIGNIDFPVFAIGFSEDYISPAHTVFTGTELVSGESEFILGGSGHVIGVINPPAKNKYGYYINGEKGKGFEHWKNSAEYNEGSWWPAWISRLKELSGKKIDVSDLKINKKYKPIEPAPGRYVFEKHKH